MYVKMAAMQNHPRPINKGKCLLKGGLFELIGIFRIGFDSWSLPLCLILVVIEVRTCTQSSGGTVASQITVSFAQFNFLNVICKLIN